MYIQKKHFGKDINEGTYLKITPPIQYLINGLTDVFSFTHFVKMIENEIGELKVTSDTDDKLIMKYLLMPAKLRID